MRDTVRPPPASLPPAGASGLPAVGIDSIPPDVTDLTRAVPLPGALMADAEPPPSRVQVVLWDESVRQKTAEPDAAPLASAEPAAADKPAGRRAIFVALALASLAALISLAAFLLRR